MKHGHLYNQLQKLLRDEEGNVFIMLAAAAFMLIAATGAAVDMTRAQILQSRISTALDAAGLAAGATANAYPACSGSVTAYQCQQNWVQSQATRYFNANFPSGYLGSAPVTPVATLSTDLSTVTLSANTTQSTTFMQAVGVMTVAVGANSTITRASEGMELVLVLDNSGSMNFAVNGQSVSSNNPSKLTQVQTSATSLINILFGTVNGNTPPVPNNLWVSVVPFTQAVNIGTSYTGWMDSSFDSSLDFGPDMSGSSCPPYTGTSPSTSGTYSSRNGTCTYTITSSATNTTGTPPAVPPATNFGMTNWAGCVLARSALSPSSPALAYDIVDTPASTSNTATLFQAYNYPSYSGAQWVSSTSSTPNPTTHRSGSTTTYTYNYSTTTTYTINSSQGPNYFCPQPLTPMTADETAILSGISGMQAGGDTDLDLGLAWGWRLLSPNWLNTWTNDTTMINNNLPLPYRTALMNKVVILMTDGMNHFLGSSSGYPGNYTAYKYLSNNALGSTNELTAEEDLDTKTKATCDALKAQGVIIYTIAFGNACPDTPPTEADRQDDTMVDSNLLSYCATDSSHYFLAPSNAQLQSAFQQIGDSLANLRVSQ